MVTYYAVYQRKGNTVTVHALNPLPLYRTFRVAGGKRRFKRTTYKATRRKVVIVAKTAKKGTKKGKEILDEELEELEEVEDLDDLEEEDDEEPEDEDEDDDDEEEDDDEDSDDLDDMTVKDLRAKAREDGHAPSAIKGLKKDDLVELVRGGVEDDDEDEDEDDDEEEEEETPKQKKKRKKAAAAKNGKAKPSRSRTTDGKVGVAEVADAAGIEGRKLRILLRKKKVEKDPDTGRYEWSSLNNKEVKQILKWVKAGEAAAAANEGIDRLKAAREAKAKKAKKTGAKRKKSKA